MSTGTLKQIFTAKEQWPAPMLEHQTAHLIAGQGVEGDRYCTKQGFWSFRKGSYRNITLITAEEIEHYNSVQNLKTLTAENLRRNLVVSGIPLESMLGQYITIGSVELYVVRLINFCPRMRDMLDSDELAKMFNSNKWKLGAHCEIIEGGDISINDTVAIKPFTYLSKQVEHNVN